MPQVSFFILDHPDDHTMIHFACRWIAKALRHGCRIYAVMDMAKGKILDQQLWSFRDDSFIPHAFISDYTDNIFEYEDVLLGTTIPKTHQFNALLSHNIMDFEQLNHFERICHIALAQSEDIEVTRTLFKMYKEHHILPKIHRI